MWRIMNGWWSRHNAILMIKENSTQPEKKSEGIIKGATELVMREIQLILSITYLVMIGIGMLFNYHRYHPFKINIFEYADIFDFLITPFQEEIIVATSMIALFIPTLCYFLDLWWSKKHPNSYKYASMGLHQKSWYGTFRYVVFMILMLHFLWKFSLTYGQFTHSNISKKAEIRIDFIDGTYHVGKKIGKTEDWVFIYDSEMQVHAIPSSSVIKMINLGTVQTKGIEKTQSPSNSEVN